MSYDIEILEEAALNNEVKTLKSAISKPQTELPTSEEASRLLILASQKGSIDCVKYILSQPIQIDLEASCDIISEFTTKQITGATSLWAASLGGHVEVVKILIEGGANVNHGTKTKSTPLRAASFHNRLEVMQYLIANGADLDATNIAGQSPLMIATLRNHSESVELLANKGADINLGSSKGLTPLHAVCVKGFIEIAKLLISLGARLEFIPPTPDLQYSYSTPCPIYQAAAYGHGDIVRYLSGFSECSSACVVDALFLLGASSFNIRRTVDSALTYWREAITLRQEENLSTHFLPPIPAYGDRQEVRSLGAMSSTADWVVYQSLMMRERILGPFYHLTSYYTFATGRYLLFHKQFASAEKVLHRSLWMIANTPINDTGYAVEDFDDFLGHLNLGILTFLKNGYSPDIPSLFKLLSSQLCRIVSRGDIVEEREEFDKALNSMLVLVSIWLDHLSDEPTEENQLLLKERDELVGKFCTEFSLLETGDTLLHILVSKYSILEDTEKEKSKPNTACVIPYISKLIGPDMLNTLNANGLSPLHMAVQKEGTARIIQLVFNLIQSGAHIDMSDKDGKTAFVLCASPQLLTIVTHSFCPLKLSCLSARAISCHLTPYINTLPTQLQQFVKIHNHACHT